MRRAGSRGSHPLRGVGNGNRLVPILLTVAGRPVSDRLADNKHAPTINHRRSSGEELRWLRD